MSAQAPFLLTIVLFAGSLSIQRVHALDLLAYFDFDDDSNLTVALDVSGNAPDAILNGPAAFTADAGGVTGTAGDRALDLGTIGNGAAAVVPAGSHFDAAANNNAMAVSFWQFSTQVPSLVGTVPPARQIGVHVDSSLIVLEFTAPIDGDLLDPANFALFRDGEAVTLVEGDPRELASGRYGLSPAEGLRVGSSYLLQIAPW